MNEIEKLDKRITQLEYSSVTKKDFQSLRKIIEKLIKNQKPIFNKHPDEKLMFQMPEPKGWGPNTSKVLDTKHEPDWDALKRQHDRATKVIKMEKESHELQDNDEVNGWYI